MAKSQPSTDREIQLLAEITRLQEEIEELRRSNHDLEVALATTAEHGDLIEADLHDLTLKLQVEIAKHQRTEAMLQTLLMITSQERYDLEVMVETIREHGDVLDMQWDQQLRQANLMANIDGLTQIPNWRRFNDYLDQQWQQALRGQTPLAIILCDIDHFKQYNDTYGHLAGDDSLKLVAKSLSAVSQRSLDLVARYRGGRIYRDLAPYVRGRGGSYCYTDAIRH
ncbi:diguanylate cyclase domain-containing protein [Neosynechococcus sphagnicola]|uniref:diguanylate cyclase domain-containing protein n=1 Tax=Neosynechococcus sphagnicola TaxID=1501145 RepID=UPI001EF9D4DB|nr:diguanylate cyclase [Neosynechococcus sphagnicola]